MKINDFVKIVKIMESVPDFAKNVFEKLDKKEELETYLNNNKNKFQILSSINLDFKKSDPLDNFLENIFENGNKKDKFEEQAINLLAFCNILKKIITPQSTKIEFFLNELIKSYNNIKKDDLKLDLKNLKLIEDQKSHDNLKIFIETYNNEIEKIKNAKIVDSQGKEITEERIKKLMQPGTQAPAPSQQSAAPDNLKEILDLIKKDYLPNEKNDKIEENYNNAKACEEIIKTVKEIASPIFDEEIKEEDKIKQVKALVLTIESLNKLYRAFFENLDSFNIEKLENNECIISNEIAKIIIFNKMHETLNKNPNTKGVAENFENVLKISDKYKKINGLLDVCKNMTTKGNQDYKFLKVDGKIFSEDSKIKKLLNSIKEDDNELGKLLNRIIVFSEELINITNLLNNILLPKEIIIN